MNLVIVESPTKARTISKFLDKNYKVLSSFGHVRDLPKSKLGIDEAKDFAPEYIIPTKAKKNLSLLKKEAIRADTITLATDEDREGEAIAWHITKALRLSRSKLKTQNSKKIERIVFHEITKEAINEALKNPREIDMKMVNAQQARRVLDRLVGYKLSPFLWKKIARGLSAGRVQSVAVRLICEREEEIKKFIKEEFWNIVAILFKNKDKEIEAILVKIDNKKLDKLAIKNEKEAKNIKDDLNKASYKILSIERKKNLKYPLGPYTTSTLQQDAAIRLHFSSKKTMFVAQKLYEGIKLEKGAPTGLITYMRTDSVNLAESFLSETQEYLKEKVGDNFTEGVRHFKTKSKSAQEAHEAIRPTSVFRDPESIKSHLSNDEARLYGIIWRRAIASQMAPAQIEITKIITEAKNNKTYELETKGEVIKFEGFLKIYKSSSKEKILPELNQGDILNLKEVVAEQKFTQPPARYSEAMLIKTLEKYGIGRPSTYAPTITTIQTRGYVEKNEEKRFKPTEIGSMVNDLLLKHFNSIIDYDFTASMEESLDDIASGKKEWVPVIKEFYEPFSKTLKEAYDKVKAQNGKAVDKKCSKCGSGMVEKFSRYGKFIACSNYPTCKYIESPDGKENNEPKYSDQKCPDCQGRLVFKRGRFGEFLGCENYPKCKHIESGKTQKTGVDCPACSSGEIVQKRTKKGRIFYACDKYPDCKFALWNKPTGEKCPDCGALMVINIKEKKFCSAGKLCAKLEEK